MSIAGTRAVGCFEVVSSAGPEGALRGHRGGHRGTVAVVNITITWAKGTAEKEGN